MTTNMQMLLGLAAVAALLWYLNNNNKDNDTSLLSAAASPPPQVQPANPTTQVPVQSGQPVATQLFGIQAAPNSSNKFLVTDEEEE